MTLPRPFGRKTTCLYALLMQTELDRASEARTQALLCLCTENYHHYMAKHDEAIANAIGWASR